MRVLNLTLIICLGLIALSCSSNDDIDRSIRTMTFNIKYNSERDGVNAWPHRKEFAASMIQFHHADLIGLQEALLGQLEDLAVSLPNYSWFGVGREDGAMEGEFMAIFYLKERFEVLENATFWLSENPDIPGKGWDSDHNRVVTWGKFKDKRTGKIFYNFNTHFDHRGEIARKESAKLLLEKIKEIAENSDVVVTGDFNFLPSSIPYKILTDDTKKEIELKLVDTKIVSFYPHHGPTGTFTGFDLSKLANNSKEIDYIFIKGGMKVLSHGTLSDTFDGVFPSDHMPVLAEIIFE